MLQIASKTYGSHPDGPDGDDNQRIEAKHPSLDRVTWIRTVVEPLQQAGTSHPKSGHRTRRAVINQKNKRQIYMK